MVPGVNVATVEVDRSWDLWSFFCGFKLHLSPSASLLSAGFPLYPPFLLHPVWLRCFARSPQRSPPQWALVCLSLDYKSSLAPGQWKIKDHVNLLLQMRIKLTIKLLTCILVMMSATLTVGFWVMLSLLCAFILLFIQLMLSFTLFSTVPISSKLKCRNRSSYSKEKPLIFNNKVNNYIRFDKDSNTQTLKKKKMMLLHLQIKSKHLLFKGI